LLFSLFVSATSVIAIGYSSKDEMGYGIAIKFDDGDDEWKEYCWFGTDKERCDDVLDWMCEMHQNDSRYTISGFEYIIVPSPYIQ